MDPKSKEMLELILAKDINNLGEDEKAFLIGRRVYLNEQQYARYASIFAPIDGGEAPVVETEEAPIAEKPTKRGKK